MPYAHSMEAARATWTDTRLDDLNDRVKDVNASQGTLVDIFSRIEYFFRRFEIYIGMAPSAAMMDIAVEIMAEILNIIGMATKEVKRGRMSKLTFTLVYDC